MKSMFKDTPSWEVNKNRYDIKVPNFNTLEKGDVAVSTCGDPDKPSFIVFVYPYDGRSSSVEKYVTVGVRRSTHYPHRINGLVENSLSFTLSIVDNEGSERFIKTFGIGHGFFDMEWLVSLKLEESAREKLVNRILLCDQSDELLKDGVLTIRFDVSYKVFRFSLKQRVTSEVKSSKVVKESDIERLEFVGLMEESLLELREFVFLYEDLTQLHKKLGTDPDIENLELLKEATIEMQGFSFFQSDFSQLHYTGTDSDLVGLKNISENVESSLQNQAANISPSREEVSFHDKVVASLKDFTEWCMGRGRIIIDREDEWERKLELMGERILLIFRLCNLNNKLKEECFNNRIWLDRNSEEILMEINRKSCFENSHWWLKGNIEKMIDQFQSTERKFPYSFCPFIEVIHFFITFMVTIDLLTDHVIHVMISIANWTPPSTETNIPNDRNRNQNPQVQQANNTNSEQLTDNPISTITIQTATGEIVVPSASKLVECSPVFQQMLSLPFREATERKITIKDFNSVTVQDLLSFVDSGGSLRKDMDRSESLSLYCMAHMYQVEPLEEIMKERMYSTMRSQAVSYVKNFCKSYGGSEAREVFGNFEEGRESYSYKKSLELLARENITFETDKNSFDFYQ